MLSMGMWWKQWLSGKNTCNTSVLCVQLKQIQNRYAFHLSEYLQFTQEHQGHVWKREFGVLTFVSELSLLSLNPQPAANDPGYCWFREHRETRLPPKQIPNQMLFFLKRLLLPEEVTMLTDPRCLWHNQNGLKTDRLLLTGALFQDSGGSKHNTITQLHLIDLNKRAKQRFVK